ncbi:MAG TPA: ABC transporter ATP-binding protein [Candidatus Binatia bacterium]|jgi:ATP-binding cassette subfamily B protein/subfamily B ATP-binding cassette protein MsbA
MKSTVRSYLRPYWGSFIFALGQVFLISAFELVKPWPLKIIIDNILSDNPLPWEFARHWSSETLLILACAGLVLVYLLLGGLRLLSDYTTVRIGQGMVNDLRRDLYSRIQRLSLSFHTRQQVGDLMYRITTDTMGIQTLTMNGFFAVLSASVLLVGMFVVMFSLDPYLTLLALIVCPALFGAIGLLNKKMSSAAAQARHKESLVYSLVQRTLSGIRVIQAFTKEQDEERRFVNASTESLAADLRLYNLQNFYSAVVNVTIAAGTAAVLWVGTRHVLSGELSVGDMVVFTSYLASLYAPLHGIFETYGVVQSAKVGVRRAFDILDSEQVVPDGHRDLGNQRAKGEISFEQVSFGYDSSKAVLKNINLRIAPGKKIAIVGPTGAGKSTLVSLLPRFYDPQSGRIAIGGIDIREFQLKSLRRKIAMVLQPPVLFPVTIRENIAYGRPEASLEQVIAAAKVAQVHDFIEELPKKYETVISEQGATLSEGQKLRLTIARGILLDAPMLILDEPTSSVDSETEALIMDGLEQLMAGRTTFIIAHRLSTVRQADLILVLRSGEIVEQGTFAELLRHRGAFASLYRTQFGLREDERHFRLVK